ncbi:chain-length determining protein [Salipiger bermudensis]|uniref:GumC family protein n=1 Tax=Salipiger bermudensis TaxID=344736 RepID=UPI001C990697|nr:Wzz/FepE/Etk N-terminal domain-containing protein [Salipiger bermudensis]MBY6004050.1 chain-length determining protein [Salipiger bermudensis]
MNQFQSIGEVLSALKRRALLIFLVTVLGSAASVWLALNQIKVFEATAVVQIEEGQVPDSLAGASAQNQDAARQVRLIEQRLMSRDNLVALMQEHELFTADPSMSMGQRLFQMREAVRIEEIRANTPSYAAQQEMPSGLRIRVALPDAQKAADIANQMMYQVINQSRDRSLSNARETLAFFESEAERVETEIEAMEAEIASFKRDNAEALPSGTGALRSQLTTLEDSQLSLEREIVEMEGNSTRQREEVLARQLGLMREQSALIEQRIAEIDATLLRAPEVERELSALERDLDRLKDQYSVITRRKADAEMGQMLEDRQQMDRFEVLETALVPEVSASSGRKKIVLAGVAASLFAGIGLAFMAELLNPAIRSAAQMERILGMQPVVSIPVIEARRDRQARRLRSITAAGLLAALTLALHRLFSEVMPWQGIVDRFLPRMARP